VVGQIRGQPGSSRRDPFGLGRGPSPAKGGVRDRWVPIRAGDARSARTAVCAVITVAVVVVGAGSGHL